MIDFEYCFKNLYLFDIENYFIEFAGLGSSPHWGSKYPTREQRKMFLREYHKHARFLSNLPNKEDQEEKLCADAHRLTTLPHLYWSL